MFIGSERAHLAELFLKEGDVSALRKMVWILSTVAAMTEMVTPNEGMKTWRDVLDQSETAVPLFRDEPESKAGQILVHNSTQYSWSPDCHYVQCEAARKINDYPRFKKIELFQFRVSTLPGEEVLKETVKWRLWSPIFSHADDTQDEDNRHRGKGLNSSAKKLLKEHMGTVEESKYANAWAARDVHQG